MENDKKNMEKKQKPKKNVYDYLEIVAKCAKKAKPIVVFVVAVAAKTAWDANKGKKKL